MEEVTLPSGWEQDNDGKKLAFCDETWDKPQLAELGGLIMPMASPSLGPIAIERFPCSRGQQYGCITIVTVEEFDIQDYGPQVSVLCTAFCCEYESLAIWSCCFLFMPQLVIMTSLFMLPLIQSS